MVGFHMDAVSKAVDYVSKKHQFKLHSQEMVDAFEKEFNCIVYSGFLEFPEERHETYFLLRFS